MTDDPKNDKVEEYLAGWKRALADYDNLKKDLAKERESMRSVLLDRFAHDFLQVLDHFDQALKHRPEFEGCDEAAQKRLRPWAEGILHIRFSLEEAIKHLGLESIEPNVGDPFHPLWHDPVGGEGETIKEVHSRGWKYHDKIFRPAKVILT